MVKKPHLHLVFITLMLLGKLQINFPFSPLRPFSIAVALHARARQLRTKSITIARKSSLK